VWDDNISSVYKSSVRLLFAIEPEITIGVGDIEGAAEAIFAGLYAQRYSFVDHSTTDALTS